MSKQKRNICPRFEEVNKEVTFKKPFFVVEIIEIKRESKRKYLPLIFLPTRDILSKHKQRTKKTLFDLLHRLRQKFTGLDFDKKFFYFVQKNVSNIFCKLFQCE